MSVLAGKLSCRMLDLQLMGDHINRPLELGQPGQLSLSSSRGRQMSSELQLDVRHLNRWRRHLVKKAYEVKAGMVFFAG